jgi:hypothetical protein
MGEPGPHEIHEPLPDGLREVSRGKEWITELSATARAVDMLAARSTRPGKLPEEGAWPNPQFSDANFPCLAHRSATLATSGVFPSHRRKTHRKPLEKPLGYDSTCPRKKPAPARLPPEDTGPKPICSPCCIIALRGGGSATGTACQGPPMPASGEFPPGGCRCRRCFRPWMDDPGGGYRATAGSCLWLVTTGGRLARLSRPHAEWTQQSPWAGGALGEGWPSDRVDRRAR